MPRIAIKLTLNGVPQTGLSPTIDIYRIDTGPSLIVDDGAMTEIGGGGYLFNFDSGAGYVETADYWFIVDGTASITNDFERYPDGVNLVPIPSDDNASVRLTAAGLEDGAIDSASIASDAITSDKIAPGAITSSEAPNLDQPVSSRQSETSAAARAAANLAAHALSLEFIKANGLENSVQDQQDYDTIAGKRVLLSARERAYDTEANAQAAGGTGLIHTYDLQFEYDSNGELEKFTRTRVGS